MYIRERGHEYTMEILNLNYIRKNKKSCCLSRKSLYLWSIEKQIKIKTMKLKSKIIASLETPLTFIHLSNLFGQDDAVEYIDWVFDNVVNMDLSGYDYPVVSDEEVYGLIEDMYVMFCYNELNYKKATEKLHAEL